MLSIFGSKCNVYCLRYRIILRIISNRSERHHDTPLLISTFTLSFTYMCKATQIQNEYVKNYRKVITGFDCLERFQNRLHTASSVWGRVWSVKKIYFSEQWNGFPRSCQITNKVFTKSFPCENSTFKWHPQFFLLSDVIKNFFIAFFQK